jgi:flavin reductase (DIM6/NTAB) family NADH-FMN oxidoreductase RutF
VLILKTVYGAYERKLVNNKDYGDHRLLAVEMVAVRLLKEGFAQEKTLDLSKVSLILYLGH